MKTLSLRALQRAAQELTEAVLVTNNGQVIGTYFPQGVETPRDTSWTVPTASVAKPLDEDWSKRPLTAAPKKSK